MPGKEKKAKEDDSVFEEWAEVTTAHGFHDFSKAKSWFGKIIWFIIIFLCLVLMVYQLYRVVSDYSKHEWITTIKEKAGSDSGGINIPSVIVCNVNRLKYSKAGEYNMTLDMIKYFLLQLQMFQTALATEYNAEDYTSDNFTEWRLANNFSFLDIFEKIGPACEDIFLQDACTEDNLHNYTVEPIYTYEYGRCYGVSTSQKASVVGSLDGAKFLMNVQGWDYLPLFYNNYASEGLVAQVTYSRNAELGQWIKLQPGTQTSISIQSVETSVQLQERTVLNPFTLLDSTPPCALNPSLKYGSGSQYSAVTCTMECVLDPIIRSCNCFPFCPSNRYRTCEAEEMISCFVASFTQNNATEEGNSTESQDDSKKCIANCPEPCNKRYLETQVSQTKFPSDRQLSEVQEYLDKQSLSQVRVQDLIYLEVYFSSLKTKEVEMYESISLEDLISNSGGLIGVWAGMSFITVFQAIAYAIMFFEKRRNRKMEKIFIHHDKKKKIDQPIRSIDDDFTAMPRLN